MQKQGRKQDGRQSKGADCENVRMPVWGIGIFIGVVCLGLGAYYEQFGDIFQKAVLICLECIGIG